MRKSRQFRRTVSTFAVVAVLLAACGGSDTADDPELAPGEAAAAESEPAPDDGASSPSGTSARSLDELFAQFGDGFGSPGQVVYQWQGAGMPVGAQMIIAQDPPNQAYRMESSEGAFHTITGDVNVVCFGTDGEWQCMPSDAGIADILGGNPLDDVYDFDDLEASDIDPGSVTISAATIADRSATCMSIAETDGVTNLVMCLDDETGMMLRTSGDTPEGSFSMEALLFMETPDPSMFVAPGEVVAIPGAPTS